jgi:hypothetical protein
MEHGDTGSAAGAPGAAKSPATEQAADFRPAVVQDGGLRHLAAGVQTQQRTRHPR